MKRRRIVISVIIGLFILAGVGYFFWQKPHVKQRIFTFNYGEEIPYDSATYLQYGSDHEDVEFDASIFSMSELGDYSVEVIYEQKAFTIHISITDQEAPTITFAQGDEVTLYRRDGSLLFTTLFHVDDISDTTYSISPDESELTNGKQEVCVLVKDAYENEKEACKVVTITIQEYDVQASANSIQASSVEELIASYMRTNNLNLSNFAFFYYSPGDGEEYIYNPDMVFNAASTIKVPLNMLYEDLQAEGKASDETTYKLIAADIEIGAGDTIKDYKVNDMIPLSYLQEQSIRNSDNTATNVLIDGLGGFTAFRNMLSQYSEATLPASFYKNNETTAAYMFDVMKRLYDKRTTYSSLIEDMKYASAGNFLQESSEVYMIAQKYGDYDSYLHSIGIVYTPKPYIVGVYTNDCVNAYQMIVDINSSLIEYQETQK